MSSNGVQAFRDLSGHEQALLAAAIAPFRLGFQLSPPPRWPVWDFVARTYDRQGKQGAKSSAPEDMLAGLPSAFTLDARTPYRLYWLGSVDAHGRPRDDSTFGLTIAGMHAARSVDPALGDLADQLAVYVGALAVNAADIPATPYTVASWNAPLPKMMAGASADGSTFPVEFPAQVLADVLRNESAPITVDGGADAYYCTLSGRALRPFIGVQTAADYLDIAWQPKQFNAVSAPPSPLTLVQTIDYFGYVFEATRYWRERREADHVVQLRSINAGASITQPAVTREEFDSRISSLWTVIDHLSLPDLPTERKQEQNKPAPSVVRLEYALDRLVTDSPYVDQVGEALQVIRAVRHIRVAAQHENPETRVRAGQARARLGLPVFPSSWSTDWDIVRSKVAGAFVSIVEAIQSSER